MDNQGEELTEADIERFRLTMRKLDAAVAKFAPESKVKHADAVSYEDVCDLALKGLASSASATPDAVVFHLPDGSQKAVLQRHLPDHAKLYAAPPEDVLWKIRVELASLVADPENPDWTPALKNGNPADAEALGRAYSLTRSSTTPSDAADLLNWIASEYIKLDPFDMPTGQGDADVGWRLSQYHQSKPHERVIYEHFKDDLPAAIRAARSATEARKNG